MIQFRVFPIKTEFFTHCGWKGEDYSKNIVQYSGRQLSNVCSIKVQCVSIRAHQRKQHICTKEPMT